MFERSRNGRSHRGVIGVEDSVAAHEAQAYRESGTSEEQSRRRFLANATIAVGGVIGLVLTIPLVGSLVPESLLTGSGKGTWVPLSAADVKALENSTNNPVKIEFQWTFQDGYLESQDKQVVWGVKLTPEQAAGFTAKRPDLFANAGGKVDYPAITMSFVVFSSICPHLGCHFSWEAEKKRFVCPCHGSEFGLEGAKLGGPAPRGLDPLPLRSKDGKVEITWITYKQQEPSRLIVSYS